VEYHVSKSGDDDCSGDVEHPFLTIQKAVNLLRAGDVCIIHSGVYRETISIEVSGTKVSPIRIEAAPGEFVQIKGTDTVTGVWEVHDGAIFKTRIDLAFDQVFIDDMMMIEARWPNASFEELLDRNSWAKTSVGSRYGKIVDPELAKTNVDWTGATATLNVAHQFYSWTRTVESHEAGTDTFTYRKDLPGITHFADKTTPWETNVYHLSGKLEALDAPGEWFLDPDACFLYFWTPDGDSPADHQVEVKTRDHGLIGRDIEYVHVSGLFLFGSTIDFTNCHHCVIDGCHLEYPTYAKQLTEFDADPHSTPSTVVSGTGNTVSNCSLLHSSTGGFSLLGSDNLIENTLVSDFCWNGSLRYVGIRVGPMARSNADTPTEAGRSVVRRCTVCGAGNACIIVEGMPGNIVEYCHIYDGGKACKDVSLLYTQLPVIYGTTFRYNWVHDCHAPHIALGIRGDDQTRGMIVHHNVVWNCGWEAIVAKGDENQVHHNTCFDNGLMDIRVDNTPEPEKPWRKQWPLLASQNGQSETYNNCAADIRGWRKEQVPPGGKSDCNFVGELVDPEHFDFRPTDGSALIDAGRKIPGINDDYAGEAPDVGAYEYGKEHWTAGYRNEFIISKPTSGKVCVSLRMPVLEDFVVTVSSEAGDVSQSELVFTPENWMNRQLVSIAGEKRVRIDAQ
jgi:hypothetical protein